MKQQILWVVEIRHWLGTKWGLDEVCFSRKEARESAIAWRRGGTPARVVKYIRSE